MRAGAARELHEMLRDSVEITDCFTERGTHDGCGECCSRFMPLTDGEIKVLRREMDRRGIGVRPEPEGVVDTTCPLLGEDRRCMLYDVRPLICRVYDCAQHASGTMPLPPLAMLRAELVDMREALA